MRGSTTLYVTGQKVNPDAQHWVVGRKLERKYRRRELKGGEWRKEELGRQREKKVGEERAIERRVGKGLGVGGGGEGGDWMESENLSANAEIKSPITIHAPRPP
jgi:hypothetical protein